MKLIIAHLPNDAFSPVRTELMDLGVLRMTVSEVHTATLQSAITLRYRGAPLHSHLRPELRLECVATRRTVANDHQRPPRLCGVGRAGRRARARGTASGILAGTRLL